jgi:DNA invertase Pin-like site-specific DNA recombinase
MQHNRMTVVGYARVSTTEQADSGAGLAAQRAAIEAECDRRGWILDQLLEDAGYSAKSLKRPGIGEALELLDAGEADAIVVAKLDRLSRSMLDFTAVMARAHHKGWAIVALDCAVDTTTPAGEAMANVLATFAQFERRLIGQRTREALAMKRAAGVRLGRPPEIPLVVAERIRAERSGGTTIRGIAAKLTAEGVPTARGGRWQPGTIARVLDAQAAAATS